MKAVIIAACIAAFWTTLAYALAHAAVEQNAAGALLSPGGTFDPFSWLIAGGYVIARFASLAAICGTFGLAIAMLAAWTLRARA